MDQNNLEILVIVRADNVVTYFTGIQVQEGAPTDSLLLWLPTPSLIPNLTLTLSVTLALTPAMPPFLSVRWARRTSLDAITPHTCPGPSPTFWAWCAWCGHVTGAPSESATPRTASRRWVWQEQPVLCGSFRPRKPQSNPGCHGHSQTPHIYCTVSDRPMYSFIWLVVLWPNSFFHLLK